MMFSIDLLKGKGLPEKTDLKRLLLRVVPFIIPVVAVMVFASDYSHDCNELTALQATLETNQRQIDKYKNEILAYDQVKGRTLQMKKCLGDIAKALNYRIQVSDMMVEMVNLLPESIFVYEIKLDRNAVQERYTDDAGQAKQRLYVKRKIKLTLCAFGTTGSDESVQAYVNELRQSTVLAGIVEDVKPCAQQLGEVDGRPAVYYEIECILKQQG